jgi:hypothetical protein
MERVPVLQRGGWIQSDVLTAGGLLDQIPADEHSSVASLVDRDGAPPHKVIQILTNLAEMPVATRNGIYQDVASGDPHVAVNAVAKAAQLPPLPDPAVVHLREATRDLEQAHKVCRVPSVSTKIGAVMTDVDRLRTRLIQETGGPA